MIRVARKCSLCGRRVADPAEYRFHKGHLTCIYMQENGLTFFDGSTPWKEGGHPVPNAPRPDNKAHTIRVSDELWAKALERATERGETVSEAVRKFLERYAR